MIGQRSELWSQAQEVQGCWPSGGCDKISNVPVLKELEEATTWVTTEKKRIRHGSDSRRGTRRQPGRARVCTREAMTGADGQEGTWS